MKLFINAKKGAIVPLVVIASCFITMYAIDYWVAYNPEENRPLALERLAQSAWLLASLYLGMLWLISFPKENYVLRKMGILMGIALSIGLSQMLPTSRDLNAYGMRAKLARNSSLSDLRSFAKDIDNIYPTTYQFNGVGKTFGREELSRAGLTAKYPFLSWWKNKYSSGPSHIIEKNGVVTVAWGGAFAGHWGLCVAVNGEKLELPIGQGVTTYRLSSDIYVFSQPD